MKKIWNLMNKISFKTLGYYIVFTIIFESVYLYMTTFGMVFIDKILVLLGISFSRIFLEKASKSFKNDIEQRSGA